jgi:nitrogen fixation protein FixH
MSGDLPKKSVPRPSDKWVPYVLIGSFFVLLLPLAPMAYYAVHTLPGVVTENAYEKGIAYNKQIAAGSRAQALGWQGEITLEAAPQSAEATVAYVLRDAQGQAISDAVVHVWLVRPAQGGMDSNFAMQAVGNGHYSAAVKLPEHGVWDVRVSATRAEENYQAEKRIVVP